MSSMSRIGKRTININNNINVDLKTDNMLIVTGPLGTLSRQFSNEFLIKIIDYKNLDSETDSKINAKLTLLPKNTIKFNNKMYGTINSHIYNMIYGVEYGYTKVLIITGVGYRCYLKEDKLEFQLGFSHNIILPIPKNIKVDVLKLTKITVKSFDKELIGLFCAKIKALKPVEPYGGKGIKYEGQYVLRRVGKKGGK